MIMKEEGDLMAESRTVLVQTRSRKTETTFSRLVRSGALLNLLYIPALLFIFHFHFLSVFKGIKISFTNWDGYNQDYKWIGFSNYSRMFTDPEILKVIRNTAIYGIGSAVFKMSSACYTPYS